MNKIAESDIEDFAINLLEAQGYHYTYAPQIAPDSDTPQRADFEQVILTDKLESAIARLNPNLPSSARDDALKQVLRIESPETITNNETFHRLLTEGVTVSIYQDNEERGDKARLIDFEDPANNHFEVLNQFAVVENGRSFRPDLILFVNGLPLVVVELKNPADERVTVKSAFQQLDTYRSALGKLFTYNAFMVASDGLEARAGTISAEYSRFMAWKSIDGTKESSHLMSQLEVLIKGMLNPATLLDLIKNFIVFEKSKREDPTSKQIAIENTKKLAAYHQYYAVNKGVTSVIEASAVEGGRKGGVIWHTQGSGKSLTMVFCTGKVIQQLNNPTVVVITDRNDLDDQLFDTFAGSKQLLRQEPIQARDRKHLKELLNVASGGVVLPRFRSFNQKKVMSTTSFRTDVTFS